MAIIARNNTQEWETPSEGLHNAVCCDVVDMGLVDTRWGQRHEVQIRWQLEEETSEGKPMLISRKFTLSLAEKSALRPFLETWRGKRFTEQELQGFDLEKLVGANGQLQVLHNDWEGRTYANVQAVLPPAKGALKMTVRDYVRVAERSQEPAAEEADSAF